MPYIAKFYDTNEKWEPINERTVSLELNILPHEDGFKYEILSNGTDIIVSQTYDPVKAWYEPMDEATAEKYGTIVTARMLTSVDVIYEAISWWGDDAYIFAKQWVLAKTYKE